jgi:biopolymer transport protein ExbD
MALSIQDDRDDGLVEVSEINVTPFIDVILVLLIIFMVAAPLSTVDIPVDLPATAAEQQPRVDTPVFVTLKSDQSIMVGEDNVAPETMAVALDRATETDHERRIFLRADRSVPYGAVMQAMNLLRNAGYLKVALVALEDNK